MQVRTTILLEDELLTSAKQYALDNKISLSQVVRDALVSKLQSAKPQRAKATSEIIDGVRKKLNMPFDL